MGHHRLVLLIVCLLERTDVNWPATAVDVRVDKII